MPEYLYVPDSAESSLISLSPLTLADPRHIDTAAEVYRGYASRLSSKLKIWPSGKGGSTTQMELLHTHLLPPKGTRHTPSNLEHALSKL